ncbi:hypothetical protein BAU15_00335 [Enterococcus sp. JM4C]|uniref:WxL domain-containing protein n=1 Tax=Candidatus Enterococcus huntleyi TaxID=1857217 RepID=UPI00137AFDC7|nr:WxL domain-containing protein [Enterococcus sp. JM4C]KAF1299127.1 hypothetical protein BAU15_00335 [Enterococcus sp. JM4C]
MKKSSIILASAILLSSLTGVAANAAPAIYETNGQIEFTEATGVTKPLDPDNPDTGVTPKDPTKPDGTPTEGTPGPLSIDFASSLIFGQQEITSETKTYFAELQKATDKEGAEISRPNYVQVSDNRGTETGWVLTVKQDGQFKTSSGVELASAKITLGDGTLATNSTSAHPTATASIALDPAGAEETVMIAAAGQGAGTYITKWGADAASAVESISLEVPGGSKKEKAVYSTKLIWSLADVPA